MSNDRGRQAKARYSRPTPNPPSGQHSHAHGQLHDTSDLWSVHSPHRLYSPRPALHRPTRVRSSRGRVPTGRSDARTGTALGVAAPAVPLLKERGVARIHPGPADHSSPVTFQPTFKLYNKRAAWTGRRCQNFWEITPGSTSSWWWAVPDHRAVVRQQFSPTGCSGPRRRSSTRWSRRSSGCGGRRPCLIRHACVLLSWVSKVVAVFRLKAVLVVLQHPSPCLERPQNAP